MGQMIDALFSFSRVGKGESIARFVDSGKVLELANQNLKMPIVESGAKIISDALPMVVGSETLLVQLFQNLIGNAIKFRRELPPEIRVSARHEGEFWQFSVSDNGIGFDMRNAERIFLLFQRLESKESRSWQRHRPCRLQAHHRDPRGPNLGRVKAGGRNDVLLHAA